MNVVQTNKPSISFWIISILALIWNLIGVLSFVLDMTISANALAEMPAEQRELYESTPHWVRVIYGLAVFSGTLGCVLLLLRKSSAYQVFILSLLAILIQMLFSLTMTKSIEVYGFFALVMPLLVIAIGIFLVWYAGNCRKINWLN